MRLCNGKRERKIRRLKEYLPGSTSIGISKARIQDDGRTDLPDKFESIEVRTIKKEGRTDIRVCPNGETKVYALQTHRNVCPTSVGVLKPEFKTG